MTSHLEYIPILLSIVCQDLVPQCDPCTSKAKACLLPSRSPMIADLFVFALGLVELYLSAKQLPTHNQANSRRRFAQRQNLCPSQLVSANMQ